MSLSTLLSVWAIALTLALLSVAMVLRPLAAILADVCGTRDRARFWTAYACVLTTIAPLMAVSTPNLLEMGMEVPDGRIFQRAVFLALAGIVFALICVGRAIWKPIALMTGSTPAPAPRTGENP